MNDGKGKEDPQPPKERQITHGGRSNLIKDLSIDKLKVNTKLDQSH